MIIKPKSPDTDRQKILKRFIERRHPKFQDMAPHWDFMEATYEGGREWFNTNIHRYIKEGNLEYTDRLQRAYRFNHTREVVDLVDKYLFKMQIARNEGNAPPSIKAFWQESTLNGQGIKEFAKTVSARASTFGRVWVVVDTNVDDDIESIADQKEKGARAYAYIVKPQHVLDMGYDDMGELNWILILETTRDDEDPILSSGEVQFQYRLWTKTDSRLFKIKKLSGNKILIIEEDPIIHGLDDVPVIRVDNVISEELYTSPAMIADVAYLDRACANYLSNLDAIIQDQTFSQLAMPASGLTPGENAYEKLVEMGTKRIFIYESSESGAQPFYLSPDVKQAELIIKVVNKIINEIYHSVGLAGERTKEDNAQGIDNSSGVAKAYDFERVNSLLAAKADSLELFENQLCEIVAAYSGEEALLEKLEDELVSYPDNFDVRGLYDEFEIAARLSLVEAPDEIRREQMRLVIDKLFPQLAEDLKEKMMSELKTWPPKLDPALAGGGKSGIDVISQTGKAALSNKLIKGGSAKV